MFQPQVDNQSIQVNRSYNMHITFVGIGWEQLGVSLLSALAKEQGHQVDLVFSVSLFNDRCHLTHGHLSSAFDDTQFVLREIERRSPDVLVFSPISGTYRWMLNVAKESKRLLPKVKTVFGGVHSTAVPGRVIANPEIDYVCVGEGDIAFLEILKAIDLGGQREPIINTRFRSPDGNIVSGEQDGFIQDLDSLPIFDKTIWEDYMQYNETYITMGSRGCPYRCTFCFNSFFANLPREPGSGYVRYRSVDHLLYELQIAKKRYDFKLVEFFDDVFTLNKNWLKEFAYKYKKEIGIPYQIFTHIKCIDEEVAKWLAGSGCRSAQIGVQSMDDEYKKRFLNRRETIYDVEKAIKFMDQYKIRAKFDHMFGLPLEPIEAQEKAKQFYAEYPPYRVQTYWVNLYPGTEMLAQCHRDGIITDEEINRLEEGHNFDTFTRSNRLIDPDKLRTYKAYELIFKLMVNLPRPLRKRLNAKVIRKIPASICGALTFIIDLVSGLAKLDIDHTSYAKYYLYHMYRFVMNKLSIRVAGGTKIHDDTGYSFYPPRYEDLGSQDEQKQVLTEA